MSGDRTAPGLHPDERDLATVLSGVEAGLLDLENEIRLRGCRIDQLHDLAAARAALTHASRCLLAQHARHRIDGCVRSRDATEVELAAAELAHLVHRFSG